MLAELNGKSLREARGDGNSGGISESKCPEILKNV